MEFQTRIFWNFYQTYCAIRTNKVAPVDPGHLAAGPKEKYIMIIRSYFGDSLYTQFNQSCMQAFRKRVQREFSINLDSFDHLWQMELYMQARLEIKEYRDFSERYWSSCKNWLKNTIK